MFARRSLPVLTAACLIAAPAAIAQVGPPLFFGIGHLNSSGSVAFAVSGDGRTIVGTASEDNNVVAARWTIDGGLQSLGLLPGGQFSIALGVSRDGSVIAGSAGTANGLRATRWTEATGIRSLGDTLDSSQGWAISSDGATIVGAGHTPEHPTAAFRWNEGDGIVPLPEILSGGFPTVATGVSDNGAVIVGSADTPNGPRGFRWTPGGGTEVIPGLPGGIQNSDASAISDDGSVIVGRVTPLGADSNRAFRWTADEGMVLLSDLPSYASAVNSDGSIAVGRNALGAAIFNADGTATDLHALLTAAGHDLSGWDLISALGVSDDGTVIAGIGRHNDLTEGWVVVIPAPGAGAFIGVVALLGSRRPRPPFPHSS